MRQIRFGRGGPYIDPARRIRDAFQALYSTG